MISFDALEFAVDYECVETPSLPPGQKAHFFSRPHSVPPDISSLILRDDGLGGKIALFLPQVEQPTKRDRISEDGYRNAGVEKLANGPLVQILPTQGESWYGRFESGSHADTVKAYGGPSDSYMSIVAGGAGYVVNTRKPKEWWWVRLDPVVDVRRIPARQMIVFVGASDIIAFTATGLLWTAEAVALDGIQLTRITSDTIEGEAAGNDVSPGLPFSVNVETGHVQGGYIGYLRKIHSRSL